MAPEDQSRPRLHLSATEGWVNDPVGLTWHDGRYHLFFQHVPGQVTWSLDQRWGHAVSDDLLHWTERPVALAPGQGDDGIWSGCVVAPADGPAALLYTSVQADALHLGSARLARPVDPSWDTWTKHQVVASTPAGLDVRVLRDPFVLRDGDRWRMLLGAQLGAGRAAALTWTSTDLETWTYDGVLAERDTTLRDPVWTGSAWECPQLLPLGDAWVLVVSAWHDEVTQHEAWAVGDLVAGRFTARSWGRLTWGPGYYAGSAFTDAHGRQGLVHWIREVADPGGRWAGVHSVPHVVRRVAGRVTLDPHPVVAAARRGAPTPVRDGGLAVTGPLDVELELDVERETAGGSVRVLLDDATLVLDASGLAVDVDGRSWTMPAGPTLRILVDGPVVEVFGDHGATAFAVRPADSGRRLHVTGAGQLRAWALDGPDGPEGRAQTKSVSPT